MHEFSSNLVGKVILGNRLLVSMESNKANLRDLIAATVLLILLKLDSNRRYFSQCDLEIWWMISKNNKATLLYYIKHGAFQIHWLIQTGVTVRKRSFWVKIDDFCPVWPWNLMFNLESSRATLLCYVKFCVSFQNHLWIQTWVTFRKRSIRVKIEHFCPVWTWNLTDDLEKQ